jgi:peptidoglycan/xylan/chitin deacetylase (PgdA/CDA1 family)
MENMFKPISFVLLSSILLTGCSVNGAVAKLKAGLQPEIIKAETLNIEETPRDSLIKTVPVFHPKAVISTSQITNKSNRVILTTKQLTEAVTEIQYYIWRTADGTENAKILSSKNKDTNFSFQFDTKEFDSKRGEYQVEAYGIKENGEEELLAKSTFSFQQRVPILMYHAVDEYKNNGLRELFVTPANFEKQMQYLKDNGFTLLTFERWGDVNKVNKPILITFDDGMKNNLNAFQILQKLQDENFQPTATEYMIAGAIDSDPGMLSSDDLKTMVNSGIFSVQAHTMSHADLPNTKNYEEELKAAKEKIEEVTGKPVVAIAYPFGKFDDMVVKETKKYYMFATTTQPGQFIETGQKDERLLMQRVRISYSTTLNEFAALVNQN